METVYDIHQFTSCAVFYFTQDEIRLASCNTSSRVSPYLSESDSIETAILEYEGQYGSEVDEKYGSEDNELYSTEEEEQYITVEENYTPNSGIADNLYSLFKKGKEKWNDDEKYYLEGIIQKLVDVTPIRPGYKSADHWHYAIIVPSRWEEEVREEIIRYIFIRANLISKHDHKDRLLFFSEIECIFYFLQDTYNFNKREEKLLSKIDILPNNEVLIHLDLIQTINTLFAFTDSKLFPKVLKSVTLSFTPQDFKDDISSSLIANILAFNKDMDSNQVEENVIDQLYSMMGFETKESQYTLSEVEDNEILEKYKDPNAIFSLCNGIRTEIAETMNYMLSNNIGKKYEVLTVQDLYTFGPKQNIGLVKWLNSLQNDSVSFVSHEAYIGSPEDDIFYLIPNNILHGAFFAIFETIKNGDIYCPPRIIDRVDPYVSPSAFLSSNPKAIIHIAISFESTELSLSLLNDDGLVNKVFDHNYFTTIKRLHSLKTFYSNLNKEERTLKRIVTESYSAGKHEVMADTEFILSHCSAKNKTLLGSQLEYITKYILLYLTHIKDVISCGWSREFVSDGSDMRIGYTVSIEKIMLNSLIGTKEDFQELIYSSGLIQKNDDFKKLIVTTNGEGILPLIKRCLALEFPLKSYFLLAQLHEDYIQLTLNQVVTSGTIDEKEQESIICQDEIIPIRNIYEWLCTSMWENLNEYRRLICLCNKHHDYKDNVVMLLSLQSNRIIFMNNLQTFISDNILAKNVNIEISNGNSIRLNNTCNCKVHLTVYDVIEVCFKPVLKEIATIVSSSLINNQLFGKYIFIEYVLTLIYFNKNSTLQPILQKILQEDAQDFNELQGIETYFWVIPEVASRILQPAIKQRPFLYKELQMGMLRQIYCRGCCFSVMVEDCLGLEPMYKNKITDLEYQSVDNDSLFMLFEKGDIISNVEIKKVLYFKLKEKIGWYKLSINYHECETLDDNGAIVLKYDVAESIGYLHVTFDAEVYSTDEYLPVVISFTPHNYSSCLHFGLNEAGFDIEKEVVLEIGEPMTLSRF